MSDTGNQRHGTISFLLSTAVCILGQSFLPVLPNNL
jgi:hypothetical protein